MLRKRLVTIYLPMTIVLAVATWAGLELWHDQDATLNEVEFIVPAAMDTLVNQAELETTPSTIVETTTQTTVEPSVVSTEAAEPTTTPTTSANTTPTTAISQTATSQANTEATAPKETTEETAVSAQIVVTVSGPGVTQRCEVPVSGSMNVHQLMKQASAQCKFSYRVKDFTSLGAFVDELGGLVSDQKNGKFWIYYVNGKKANIGVSGYTAQPDDVVAWVYEQEY